MVLLLITVIALTAATAEYLFMNKTREIKTALLFYLKDMVLVHLVSYYFISNNGWHFFYTSGYDTNMYLSVVGIAVGVSAAVLLNSYLVRQLNTYQKGDYKHTKLTLALKLIFVVLFFVGVAVYYGSYFIYHEWSGVSLEQIIVNMSSPTTGTEIGIYVRGFEHVAVALGLTVLLGGYALKRHKMVLGKRKQINISAEPIKVVVSAFLAVLVLVNGFSYAQKKLHVSDLHKILFVHSDFIEENYVPTNDTVLQAPKEKRNLIFIYLESIENSYLSRDLGGYMDENLMPELTKKAMEGVTFSNTGGRFGGPIQINGTSWSLASMVNQSMGIPMKATDSLWAYATPQQFLKGARGIGDVLAEQGYTQTVMIGANATFGGLDLMYQTHGGFKVYDYNYARLHQKIPHDYRVWWGFEDDKLYAFAKEEITAMYETGKPFNFTMENADTHMPNGYLAPGSPTPYKSPYANAIAYSTRQVTRFVEWIQQQPFYENTTVVLIGDHLSMDKAFFNSFDDGYLRTQFNVILNPAPEVADTDASRFVNRTYANFDMYPTVMAALGYKIEGDRLGIGTNLFSDKQTLMEQYGVDYMDNELKKHSDFYCETLAKVEP